MLLGDGVYEELLRQSSEAAFRDALTAAFDRLELVGVQESYEEVMIVAMLVFGWPRINPRKRMNVRREDNPVRFSEEDVATITRMNHWDALAHRMAGERFAATYRKHAASAAMLKFRFSLQRAAAEIHGRLAGRIAEWRL
jgi:hypothetical protein